MTITDKAKKKMDEASKEIKTAVDNLTKEVAELSEKVKEKFKGTGEEMRETAANLNREVKELSEKVKQLIPRKRQKHQLPVHTSTEFPHDEFHREFNLLRDDIFNRFGFPSISETFGSRWPHMDIGETDDDILIAAELPGVDKKDIDISVTQNKITIRGEKKSKEEKKGHGYYHMERSYGAFHRSIPLPLEVDSNKVGAAFKNGVLTVTIPKSAEARNRIKKISVRTG